MTQNNNEKTLEDRKFVAKLINAVLCGKISVREALLKYPNDSTDRSLKAVYHALIHREADEDLRYRDLDYKEEQDDYLAFLAENLNRGIGVPENIIKEYDDFYKDISEPYSDNVKHILKKLCKFLNV